MALAQFVVLALVFNKGMPHRSPLWTNLWLVAVLVIQVGEETRAALATYGKHACVLTRCFNCADSHPPPSLHKYS